MDSRLKTSGVTKVRKECVKLRLSGLPGKNAGAEKRRAFYTFTAIPASYRGLYNWDAGKTSKPINLPRSREKKLPDFQITQFSISSRLTRRKDLTANFHSRKHSIIEAIPLLPGGRHWQEALYLEALLSFLEKLQALWERAPAGKQWLFHSW